jgi:hypothetical protein
MIEAVVWMTQHSTFSMALRERRLSPCPPFKPLPRVGSPDAEEKHWSFRFCY